MKKMEEKKRAVQSNNEYNFKELKISTCLHKTKGKYILILSN